MLFLSESRNRHKNNLEKERSRHAQELVRIERAHHQEIQSIRQSSITEIQLLREEVSENLKETQAVSSWLGYETMGPFRNIKEIREMQKGLEKGLRHIFDESGKPNSGKDTQKWDTLEASLKTMTNSLNNIGNQLDGLRREIEDTKSLIADPKQQLGVWQH